MSVSGHEDSVQHLPEHERVLYAHAMPVVDEDDPWTEFDRRDKAEDKEDQPSPREPIDASVRLFPPTPPRTHFERGRRGTAIKRMVQSLMRQRQSLTLAMIAVAIGVAYLTGALGLLARVQDGLAAQAGAGSEPADIVLEGTIASDSAIQQVRRLIPQELAVQARALPSVQAAEVRIEGSAIVIGADDTAILGFGLTERPLGLNWPVEDSLNPFELVEGRPPAGANEVVLEASTASAAGVGMNATVQVATNTRKVDALVVGIARSRSGSTVPGSTMAFFDLNTARELFLMATDANAVAIKLAPGADSQQTVQQLRTYGVVAVDGPTYVAHRQTSLAKSFTLIQALLGGFAIMTIFVGAFTVSNSMALLFDHRRRSFALLRLTGARPRQLVHASVVEAVVIGVVAGVFGAGLGIALSLALQRIMEASGTNLPLAGPLVRWWIPIVGICIGAFIAALSALRPARAASRVSPLEAMAPLTPRRKSTPFTAWLAVMFAIGLIVGGIGLIGFGGIWMQVTGTVLIVGGGALGLVLLLGLAISASVRVVNLADPGREAIGRLGRRGRSRSASRSAAALAVAVAVVVCLTVIRASLVESLTDQASRAFTGDLIVDSGTIARGGLSQELIDAIRSRPEVADFVEWRPGLMYLGSNQTALRIAGMNHAEVFSVLNLDLVEGSKDTLSANGMAVEVDVAQRLGLTLGSTVDTLWQKGTTTPLTVEAIYQSPFGAILGDAIVDAPLVTENIPLSPSVVGFVKARDGVDVAALRIELDGLAKIFGARGVTDASTLIASRSELLNGFAQVIQWLVAFSVVLAMIGVANTLQLAVRSRVQQFGLARAIGASRSQLVRLIAGEAVGMGVVASLAGAGIGIGVAALTTQALGEFGLSQLTIPWGPVLAGVGAAAALGVVGMVLPARTIARVAPLAAIYRADDVVALRKRAIVTTLPRASSPIRSEPGSTRASPGRDEGDDLMPALCFQCGEEPGTGDFCTHCGARQSSAPLGMFSVKPEHTQPAAQQSQPAAAEPVAHATIDATESVEFSPSEPLWTAAEQEPEDAEIIEEPAAAAVFRPANDHAPSNTVPLGSVFEDNGAPPASPFGFGSVASAARPANTEVPVSIEDPEDVAGEHVPTSPPTAKPSGTSVFEGVPSEPVPDTGTDPIAFGDPPPSAVHALHGPRGLEGAIRSLDAGSVQRARTALVSTIGQLDSDEEVIGCIVGTHEGAPAAALATTVRVLVCVDDQLIPEVAIHPIGPELLLHGQHSGGVASVEFVIGESRTVIAEIVDVDAAIATVGAIRARKSVTSF